MRSENRMYVMSHGETGAVNYGACNIYKPRGRDVEPETFFLASYNSPLGTYILVSSLSGIVCIAPAEEAEKLLKRWEQYGVRLKRDGEYNGILKRELEAYFAGWLRQFTVPLDLRGTMFQRQVWEMLCSIPYAETCSYRDVAQAIGNPKATRAVGQAIGSNPVAIVVPCHRVIGSDGRLTGYGGGLRRKQALLDLEGATLPKVGV
jgi:O-6-methylguanine DNA methyltransferase